MKAIDIENLLKAELVGKNYDPYGWEVGNAVRNYLANNGFDGSKLTYERDRRGSTIYIAVNAPRNLGGPCKFITIEVKKAKGKTHCWGCDWSYKDFLVSTYQYTTVEEACEAAVDLIYNNKEKRDDKLSKAQDIFKILKDAGYSESTATELVRLASENGYSLARAVYRPDEKY